MRSPLRFVALAIVLAAPVAAQEGQPQPQPPRERRGPPMGMPGGEWTRQAAQFLKDELDLDDEQVERVKGVFDQAIPNAMRKMAEAWGAGEEFNYDRLRGAMDEVRVQVTRDIAQVLTPAQQREFDALIEQFDQRAQRWEQGRRAYDDPMLAFEPAPLSKRVLMEKAERALGLPPEELRVVLPLVEKVIDRKMARQEARIIRRKDLTAAIDGGATPDEVQQRVRELRASEQFEQLELVAAMQELRDVLTIEQEIRLVTMGVLD